MKFLNHMNHTFKELYLQMLFESSGIMPFSLNKYLNFLKTAVKFKDGKIISEDKNLLIDISVELFNYCYDHQKEYIKFAEVKKLMKNSKHYTNIKNIEGPDLYFTVFNFDDDGEITEFHRKFFNESATESLVKMEQEFKKACIKCDGFFNYYEDKAVCVINSLTSNIGTTIYHELSHFIQTICNIRITKEIQIDKNIENNPKFQKLKQLNITYKDLNYYFSSLEFSTHIDDLIIGLWNTYLMFYQKQFPDILFFTFYIRDEFENNNDFKQSKLLFNYSIANNSNIAPLIMYVAAFYFNLKYQKVNNAVNYRLKNKFYQWKNEQQKENN